MSKPEPKETDSHRGLRIVVISMGLVLIGGTILLFILAINKMKGEAGTAETAHIPRIYRDCGDHTLKLPEGAEPMEVQYDGVIAKVVSQDTANRIMRIHLVHLCSGESLGTVTME